MCQRWMCLPGGESSVTLLKGPWRVPLSIAGRNEVGSMVCDVSWHLAKDRGEMSQIVPEFLSPP